MHITAHIVVRGAAEAADWYSRAFGFEEVSRLAVPDGRFMSIVMRYGASELHLCDEFPEMGVVVGDPSGALQLSTDDADALWARATGAGASVVRELADAFWGERHGQLTDPYGRRWNIGQHVRDVPLDEQSRVVAEMFAAAGPANGGR
jgi:PhnB protein